MPRALNTEKLEKKFLSLSRSRESIQGLSSWIMHHKQFSVEIAEEWLKYLKSDKNFNVLNLLYVANDVIQHCFKKGAGEFRPAFSEVLVDAVKLQKMKDLRPEFNRIINIWHERGIYSAAYITDLQRSLERDATPEIVSNDSEEVDEYEAISKFKVQDLKKHFEEIKNLATTTSEKENVLRTLEEPEMPSYDLLIVRLEGHKVAREFETYHKALVEYLDVANKALKERKKVITMMKYGSVFVSAQYNEVKKVAHAYRIYDKKLIHMQETLSNKLDELRLAFPSPKEDSPYQPDVEHTLSSKSSVSGISSVEPDENSSMSENTPKILQSPQNELIRKLSISSADSTSYRRKHTPVKNTDTPGQTTPKSEKASDRGFRARHRSDSLDERLRICASGIGLKRKIDVMLETPEETAENPVESAMTSPCEINKKPKLIVEDVKSDDSLPPTNNDIQKSEVMTTPEYEKISLPPTNNDIQKSEVMTTPEYEKIPPQSPADASKLDDSEIPEQITQKTSTENSLHDTKDSITLSPVLSTPKSEFNVDEQKAAVIEKKPIIEKSKPKPVPSKFLKAMKTLSNYFSKPKSQRNDGGIFASEKNQLKAPIIPLKTLLNVFPYVMKTQNALNEPKDKLITSLGVNRSEVKGEQTSTALSDSNFNVMDMEMDDSNE